MKQLLLPGAEELSGKFPLMCYWLQLASAYLNLDAARTLRSPSPSVSSNYAVPSSESSDDKIWRKYVRERETSPEEYKNVWHAGASNFQTRISTVFAFENSVQKVLFE